MPVNRLFTYGFHSLPCVSRGGLCHEPAGIENDEHAPLNRLKAIDETVLADPQAKAGNPVYIRLLYMDIDTDL